MTGPAKPESTTEVAVVTAVACAEGVGGVIAVVAGVVGVGIAITVVDVGIDVGAGVGAMAVGVGELSQPAAITVIARIKIKRILELRSCLDHLTFSEPPLL